MTSIIVDDISWPLPWLRVARLTESSGGVVHFLVQFLGDLQFNPNNLIQSPLALVSENCMGKGNGWCFMNGVKVVASHCCNQTFLCDWCVMIVTAEFLPFFYLLEWAQRHHRHKRKQLFLQSLFPKVLDWCRWNTVFCCKMELVNLKPTVFHNSYVRGETSFV